MSIKGNEITSVDLMITNKCNLTCSYCFHPKSSEVMDEETGKKILDRLYAISPEKMSVNFFGGEPLLYPETVLHLAQYAKTLWKAPKFTISTNGLYFDEAMFKAYKELGFAIQVSIDGDEVTMKERCDADRSHEIYNNAKRMLVIFPTLSCRMTYTPKTVERLSINVKFIVEELGIMNIMHHATMESNWDAETIMKYRYQLNQLYHYRRFLRRNNYNVQITFIEKCLNILNDDALAETNFCEAGKSYIALMPNGDVYPCHRAASNRIFKLGNIFNEKVPFVRGMFLQIDKNYINQCSKCEAKATCHSCIITHYLVNQDLCVPLDKYCGICKEEFREAFAFLPTEINDKQTALLKKLSSVIADTAEQNEKIIDYLAKLNLLEKINDTNGTVAK